MAPSSLRAFLSTAKKSLASAIANQKHVNLVIGNESADLDSITSSILYAYFRSSSPTPTSHNSLYIPILNFPAADMRIRPELTALLPHANITPHHLITLSDLPPFSSLESQLKPELTRWILVDHNALQGTLGEIYASRVVGCIDHHVDEGKVPERDDHDPRIITKTGSCQSLVINHFRQTWDALSDSSSSSNTAGGQSDAIIGQDDSAVRRTWDAQLARFALASILIDTHELQSADKVTQHDRDAVKYLESKIHLAPKSGAVFERKSFFDEISKAKSDLESLGLEEILRKDYKQWSEQGKKLGICSIVKPLRYLSGKCTDDSEFFSTVDRFGVERGLGIVALMTTSTSESGQFQRELVVRVLDPGCVEMVKGFERDAGGELGLDGKHESSELAAAKSGVRGGKGEGEDKLTRIWWQRNLGSSRKQVGPLLRKAMLA